MATDKFNLENLDTEALTERLNAALEDEETSRSVLLVGGGALALFGLTRLTPIGLLLSLVGGGLVYLGAQKKSLATYGRELSNMTIARGGSAIDVEKTIIVNRPHDEVYRFWHDFRNLARFMKHIEGVDVLDDKRSVWRAKLFRGTPTVEWHAETIEDIPNQRISWRSFPDSDVETFGSVRFESVHGGTATEVRVLMEYRPPGGPIAKLLNPALNSMIQEDLRRFKRMVEGRDESVGATQRDVSVGTPRFDYE
jgi:uncharacterized membrane protein